MPTDATALPHRYALAKMMVMTGWDVADGSEVEGNEGAQAPNANYLGNYPRLARIKQPYDPTNLFRLNANISPAG